MEFVARFLGRTISYIYEIRDNVDGERFVMATTDGPMQMETTYSWSDAPSGGTLMRLRNRGEPSGFSALPAPIMGGAMRRELIFRGRRDAYQPTREALGPLTTKCSRSRRTRPVRGRSTGRTIGQITIRAAASLGANGAQAA